MISSGPRSGFSVSTFTSVHGFRFAAAAWNSGTPAAGTAYVVVELLRLVLGHRVGEGVPELVVGQRDGPVPVAPGCPGPGRADFSAENGSGSTPGTAPGRWRPTPADRPRPATIWVSRPPNECPTTTGLRSSRPMTSLKWSATSPTDLLANTSGCSLGLLDGVGIVGPARRQRRVAGRREHLGPPVPAAGQQPQAVDEHDGRTPGGVGAGHLLFGCLGHDAHHRPPAVHKVSSRKVSCLLRHSQVPVGQALLHVVEDGDPGAPPALFPHGRPSPTTPRITPEARAEYARA